jgi:hypothetical protein
MKAAPATHPAQAFAHPRDVVHDPDLAVNAGANS